MSDQQAYVKVEIQDALAVIEFFHPSSNSLPASILSELANKITELGQDDKVRVILLKSGGERAFCAGRVLMN